MTSYCRELQTVVPTYIEPYKGITTLQLKFTSKIFYQTVLIKPIHYIKFISPVGTNSMICKQYKTMHNVR